MNKIVVGVLNIKFDEDVLDKMEEWITTHQPEAELTVVGTAMAGTVIETVRNKLIDLDQEEISAMLVDPASFSAQELSALETVCKQKDISLAHI